MKVFDLHCGQGHIFEGWFGSEADYQEQQQRGLLECPVCGDGTITKGLSAPRLNLGVAAPQSQQSEQAAEVLESAEPAKGAAPVTTLPDGTPEKLRAMQAAWLQLSRQLAQGSEDVGTHFTEQALAMHRGEQAEKPIRGQATPEQARELVEEGVPILPLALPKISGETLQ